MSPSLDTDVLIIGAGMSGIGFAIQLQKKYPLATFEIVEKADDLGGTWWANTYPGCGCDVASHFYSYSFALKPDWTRKFALQPEIVAYFRDVAQRHDIPRHISFRSTVQNAEFDETTGTWLTTVLDQRTGQVRQRRSRVLIAAVGALSVPKGCEIKGAERYQGRMFHSAQWDHSFDWTDKEVVVIGTFLLLACGERSTDLTVLRQWMQCYSVRPHSVQRHQRRRLPRQGKRQGQESRPIQPAASLDRRAAQPGVLAGLQVDDALRASGHASVPVLPVRAHGVRLLRVRHRRRP